MVRQEVFVCCRSEQITADNADDASHNSCDILKFCPRAARYRKEVNLGTSSQSVGALSYLGSEAWSEFYIGGQRDGVMSQPWLRGPGHITPIISQREWAREYGGGKKAKGAKQRLALREQEGEL